jgi:hypothetical protein
MKYVWIVMLAVGDIVWGIGALIDFIQDFQDWFRAGGYSDLHDYLSVRCMAFIIAHLMALFVYSLCLFVT